MIIEDGIYIYPMNMKITDDYEYIMQMYVSEFYKCLLCEQIEQSCIWADMRLTSSAK